MRVGHRGIELAAQLLDAAGVVAVRVPAAHLHFHEGDAVFDQPAGEQAAVAEAASAVSIANGGGLLAQVEGLALLRVHQAGGR